MKRPTPLFFQFRVFSVFSGLKSVIQEQQGRFIDAGYRGVGSLKPRNTRNTRRISGERRFGQIQRPTPLFFQFRVFSVFGGLKSVIQEQQGRFIDAGYRGLRSLKPRNTRNTQMISGERRFGQIQRPTPPSSISRYSAYSAV
jgi:hypothetical protein